MRCTNPSCWSLVPRALSTGSTASRPRKLLYWTLVDRINQWGGNSRWGKVVCCMYIARLFDQSMEIAKEEKRAAVS